MTISAMLMVLLFVAGVEDPLLVWLVSFAFLELHEARRAQTTPSASDIVAAVCARRIGGLLWPCMSAVL
jgi:hypothetical protein